MFPYITFVIPSYGLMAFIGLFACVVFIYLRKDKFEIEFGTFLKMAFLAVIGMFLGSKLLYAVTQIPWLIDNFSFYNLATLIPNSGFVFYGGLLGAMAGVWFYIRRSKCCDMKTAFNFIVPAFPFFHFFGRIGCFMSGCCYGKELSSPIHFEGLFTLNRIPTQLIEALFELLLFIAILIIGRKNKDVSLLKVYLFCYSIFRFIIEFFRGDEERGIWFGLSTSQWISIVLFGAVIYTHFAKKKAPETSEEQ